MSEEQKRYVPAEWVFIGLRIGKGDKRTYGWAAVKDLAQRAYFKNKIAPASVGGVYVIHETEDGASMVVKGEYGPKFAYRLDDADQIHIWAVQEEEAIQHFASKSLNTKAAKVEPLEDIFKQIRKLTRHLTPAEKRALVARLIAEIIG